MAKSVIGDEDENIDRLIVYQALLYRSEWNIFLQLISNDETRQSFLIQYPKISKKLKSVSDPEQLDTISKELFMDKLSEQESFKQNLPIYREIIKQGGNLMDFLEPTTLEILSNIGDMEKYRRAFDVTDVVSTTKVQKDVTNTIYLEGLLREGKILDFNTIIKEFNMTNLDFVGALLSHSNLSGANLSGANLSGAKLENALLYLDKFKIDAMRIDNKTSFKDIIIGDSRIISYLQMKIPPENMPKLITNKKEMERELRSRGLPKYMTEKLLLDEFKEWFPV